MEVSLNLDGGPELERALKKLTAELRDEILLEAMLAAGEPIRHEASSRAPRGKTGILTDNIVVSPGVRYKPSVRIGIGDAGWYGRMVELGTKPRETKAGGSRGQVQAQPFLKPAFEAQKSVALKTFRDVIRKRLGLE